MTDKSFPRKFTANWRVMVDYRLANGYGVEDIAIQLGADVADVRSYVRSIEPDRLRRMFAPSAVTSPPAVNEWHGQNGIFD